MHEEAASQGSAAYGLELFSQSGVYEWKVNPAEAGVIHLGLGEDETAFHWSYVRPLLRVLLKLRPHVVFVPAYWHWSLLINFLARVLGARVVMMNETHAGTSRSMGIVGRMKSLVVRSFHAALVGGTPHKRYFSALGLPGARIFTGYDAVDNDYFAEAANRCRAARQDTQAALKLPPRYFLSLGRMVAKKNLPMLVEAYALLSRRITLEHALVLVGSGPMMADLKALCRTLELPVVDHEVHEVAAAPTTLEREAAEQEAVPSVHFYGFRQIDENPAFYALAEAFVLPSTLEEWGLVVNEAMACGLPVIVSRQAGCSFDLLEAAAPNAAVGGLAAETSEIIDRCRRKNGFAFDAGSVEELVACLEWIALSPQQQRERMGAESRRIVEKFSCRNFGCAGLRAAQAAVQVAARRLRRL